MKVLNEILLRRKYKVILKDFQEVGEPEKENQMIVATFAKNIESLGFKISKDVFDRLSKYPKDELEKVCLDIINELKILVGADVQYNPMYPNFPYQVMEADNIELFINAILHYFTFGEYMPEYDKDERMPLLGNPDLKEINIGEFKDIISLFVNLLSSKTNLSDQDKKDVETFINNLKGYEKYLPEEMPLKENVGYVCKLIIEKEGRNGEAIIRKYFKTATDVLRFIVSLSGGDVSLATHTKTKNIPRRYRDVIMELLLNCSNRQEDLYRHRMKWIHVGNVLHPFEYLKKTKRKAVKYEEVISDFKKIRNVKKPKFFAGQVQELINNKDINGAVDLLKKRPGEFARRIDDLVRDAKDKHYVIANFSCVASKVSVPVLLQLLNHFDNRRKENQIRVFFPKGSFTKVYSKANDLKPIEEQYCNMICSICKVAIREQLSKKEFVGNVYIDDEFKNMIVPFNQRSASDGKNIVVRGSKFKIDDKINVIRPFIWWNRNCDIDLSVGFYDENWCSGYADHVSYTKLKIEGCACHSGDITRCQSEDGVAEFIDLNIDGALKAGYRYAVFQVYSYSGQPFNKTNTRFGWMEREDMNSGEIFEPATVKSNINLNTDALISIPVVFDLKDRQMVWFDMNISMPNTRSDIGGNNIESNIVGNTAVFYAMMNMSKPNLYTLCMLNAQARGNIVENRNDANIIFSNDMTKPIEIINTIDEETGKMKCVERIKDEVPIIRSSDFDFIASQLM